MNYYKTIKYELREWTTYDGKQATAYYCSDPILLKEYGTIEFGTKSIEQMHTKIDYYLEKAPYQEAIRARKNQAVQEFYASMGENKGD
tara:strand:+ start:262 stop:525 length:264 start_codon:yes stop_codon:yes gene_type:complete